MKRWALAVVGLASCAALPFAGDTESKTIEPAAETPIVEAPTAAWDPSTIPDVAERAVKSVVNVSSRKTVAVRQQPSPFSNDPFFRQFFGVPDGRMAPREHLREGQGSGVVVDAERGLIVTNNHVVDGADELEVAFSDGETYPAELVGTDPRTDLALIELTERPDDLQALPIGDSEALRLGETVLAVGNPFGVGQTVTMGIVSATGRANMGIVDYEDFIQTDAAINPGNSGGALVNLSGELVGINTAIVSRGGGNNGIGFAIPTSMVQPVVEDLLDDGAVQRGYLGVMIQELDADLAQALELDGEQGIVVSDVVQDGPAAKAGFRTGDVIVGLQGEPVESTAKFRSRIAGLGPEAKFEIDVLRDGKRKALKGRLGLLPGADEPGPTASSSDALDGLHLESMSATHRDQHAIPDRIDGVVVTGVDRGSVAERTGIRAGDVLTEVNRRPVRTPGDVAKALKGADRALLLIYRDGHTRFAVLDLE